MNSLLETSHQWSSLLCFSLHLSCSSDIKFSTGSWYHNYDNSAFFLAPSFSQFSFLLSLLATALALFCVFLGHNFLVRPNQFQPHIVSLHVSTAHLVTFQYKLTLNPGVNIFADVPVFLCPKYWVTLAWPGELLTISAYFRDFVFKPHSQSPISNHAHLRELSLIYRKVLRLFLVLWKTEDLRHSKEKYKRNLHFTRWLYKILENLVGRFSSRTFC